MLFCFVGTDRNKARAALNKKIALVARGERVVRVTDAHTADDLQSALRGGGMFGEKQAAVFEDVCAREAMRSAFLTALPALRDAREPFFVLEERPDAELSRTLKKYANEYVTFSALREEKDASIFALAHAMRSGDKKALWLVLQRELLKGKAPEALHGILFWAAKDMLLKAGGVATKERAAEFVAFLTELPHEARRRGVELEYALERFALSGT